jgi:hypothetical protein
MFDLYKSFQANAKLTQEFATQLTAASVEFTKTITDVNTRFAETVKTQATEAYKSLEAFKLPGYDTVAKTTKKTAE